MVKNRSDFWQASILLGPILCLLLVPAAGSALGAFDDFEWVGKKVSPLQAFILMGAMCFPVAAGFLASIGRNEALAQISQDWPTTRGLPESIVSERRATLGGRGSRVVQVPALSPQGFEVSCFV